MSLHATQAVARHCTEEAFAVLRARLDEIHHAEKEKDFEQKLKEAERKILRMKGKELELTISRTFARLVAILPCAPFVLSTARSVATCCVWRCKYFVCVWHPRFLSTSAGFQPCTHIHTHDWQANTSKKTS